MIGMIFDMIGLPDKYQHGNAIPVSQQIAECGSNSICINIDCMYSDCNNSNSSNNDGSNSDGSNSDSGNSDGSNLQQ
jgi:hypothetical protein